MEQFSSLRPAGMPCIIKGQYVLSLIHRKEGLPHEISHQGEGAVWLYEEIHPAQGGNEYHALLWREDDQLLYFTVFAKDLRMYED